MNEVFGYGSVPVDLVNENREAFVSVMRKWKWHAIKGVLNVGFLREKPKMVDLEFGHAPDKKEVKKILKDIQKANDTENKLSA